MILVLTAIKAGQLELLKQIEKGNRRMTIGPSMSDPRSYLNYGRGNSSNYLSPQKGVVRNSSLSIKPS